MTTAVLSQGFTQDNFDAFLAARDEPGWLTDLRNQAWRHFSDIAFPTQREEEWMRTDIRLFSLNRFALPSSDAAGDEPPSVLLSEQLDPLGRTASLNSVSRIEELDESLAKQGVLFGSLERLVAEHPDRLRPYFERRIVDPLQDKFSALASACWSGGTLLLVPRGVEISGALHALSGMQDGRVDLSRMLVVLEEGAEATLVCETASSQPTDGGLHCGAIELSVASGARLRYVNLQNWGSKVWHFAHQKAEVGRDAQLQWTIGALGSRLAKVNQHVALTGEGAHVQVNGVMFTEGRQHLSYHTLQHHMAASCHSDLLYKAALQDESRTVWRGMIKVDTAAQKTNAYQRNDNLMLSSDARADSIPGLEIEADDVRCTHGSTSGRVDEEQIFYCRNRGLTRREAVRMIVTGFFQQVFDRITIESARESLGQAVAHRVREYE